MSKNYKETLLKVVEKNANPPTGRNTTLTLLPTSQESMKQQSSSDSSKTVGENYDSLSSREIRVEFVQKTKISLSYNPAIPLLNMDPKKFKST